MRDSVALKFRLNKIEEVRESSLEAGLSLYRKEHLEAAGAKASAALLEQAAIHALPNDNLLVIPLEELLK